MNPEKGCPYRLVSLAEGMRCFDPWQAEFLKPTTEMMETWCRFDYRSCPNVIYYEDNLRAGMRKHFML